MPHFFVSQQLIPGTTTTVSGAEAHHMLHVWRCKPGDTVVLSDGSGCFFPSRIMAVQADQAVCQVLEQQAAHSEPPVKLVVVQGLAKGEKMDLIMQKCTELGAGEFWPVSCQRSVVRLNALKAAARQQRWQRIVQGAAKQCGRAVVPPVQPLKTWEQALGLIPAQALTLLLWEEEKVQSLKMLLHNTAPRRDIYLLIGPEGGLTPQEAAAAQSQGAQGVTLGPRILRTETAGLAAAAMVLYAWGDLGGVVGHG